MAAPDQSLLAADRINRNARSAAGPMPVSNSRRVAFIGSRPLPWPSLPPSKTQKRALRARQIESALRESADSWQARGVAEVDEIWNRAALEGGGPHPREGDRALCQLLRFHGLAMSGGLLDAVEQSDRASVTAAVAGYRFFGLDEAASVVEGVAEQRVAIGDDPTEGALDRLAMSADEDYASVVPDDSTILHRVAHRVKRSPTAFAPVT